MKRQPCNWLALSLRKQNTRGYDLTGFFLEEEEKKRNRKRQRKRRKTGRRKKRENSKEEDGKERKVKGEGRLGRKRKNNFSHQDFHRSASCDS